MSAELRQRKGGDRAAKAAPPAGGAKRKEPPAAQPRGLPQPTLHEAVENLQRWGTVCEVVGNTVSAFFGLLCAVAVWLCPCCGRERKRLLECAPRSSCPSRSLLSVCSC